MNALAGIAPGLQAAAVFALAALVLLAVSPRAARKLGAPLGVLAAALAVALAWRAPGADTAAVTAIGAITGLALLLVTDADLEFGAHRIDCGALVLLGAAGAVVLATASHLVTLVLGIETLSLTVAAICGLGRGSRPLEAAFKFFVLAAIGLGALVYGTGLFAYATGSFMLTAPPLPGLETVHQTATVLLTLGVAFELALVPLHFGALGAYTAMPAGLAAFATTAGKLGAGFALLRIGGTFDGSIVGPVLIALGLLSIAWSTLAGMAQRELRSLLAYSAVGHGGFVALAIGCGPQGRQAAIFYLLTYAAASALVFASLADRGAEPVPLADLRRRPLPRGRALALTAGLLSLAGLPPSPGLWAKIAVLVPAWAVAGPAVALLAALGGVAGALYYLRPVPDLLAGIRGGRPAAPAASGAAVLVAGLAVLALTVLPWLGTRLCELAGN